MFSTIHNRLGTAGFVIAIVALVAALVGTAFAAAGLNSKQKKEVKSIVKSMQKPGPKGPKGAKGANGAAGAQGPKGDTGAQGPKGEPWTAGGTLPSGATETGSWGAQFNGEGLAAISFPIPLAAPLAAPQVKRVSEGETPPAQCDNGTGAASSGANPEADPGFLCVYVTYSEGGGAVIAGGIKDPTTVESGAGRFGATLLLGSSEPALALGSFAVTAP